MDFSLALGSGRRGSLGNEVDDYPAYLFRFHTMQITTKHVSTTINAEPRATKAMKIMLNFCWWPLSDVTIIIWVRTVDETKLISVEADDVSAPVVVFRWTGVLVTRMLLTDGFETRVLFTDGFETRVLLTDGFEVGTMSVTIGREKYA